MKQTIKKLFMSLVLLLVIVATAAGQGGGVAYAAKQTEGTPVAPLAPGYTWNDLGQTTRSITLNIKGDSISLSGATYQAAERFGTQLPQEMLSFYSNEQLFNDGWTSDNSFETPEGLHQIFYHESGVYLAVDFVACADDASATCVTVWLSDQASSAVVVAGPALPDASIEPNASTFGKTAPVDGATVTTPTSVTLAWGAYSPTPEKYSYCVKEGSKCADADPNWTGNLTSTSVKLSLSSGKKYYWQVKAITCTSCTPKTVVYANSGVWWTFTTTSNTISGNAGVAGATLTYADSGTKTVTSDSLGNYVINPSYNWTGTVTPSKTGYTFLPVSIPYSNVKTNLTGQNYVATALKYTISGNAGLAGVTLSYIDGIAKTVISDGSGAFTITVPFGWTGTLTPSKDCTSFTPASISFTNVSSNLTGYNFTTASALVTITGNAGLAGVNLAYTDGVAHNVVAGVGGNYSITVSCPWVGTNTVTPSLAGFTFSDASRSYTNLTTNKIGQNFTALVSISGSAGVGATIGYLNGVTPETVTTDGSGNYTLDVPYDWSGRLTPTKSGTVFTPTYIDLTNVIAAQTGKNFTQAAGFNISGSAGVAGATLSFTDGVAQTTTSDGLGNYTLAVTSGWSGDVTPSKPGYVFSPTKKTYASVAVDQTAQNYTVSSVSAFADVATSFWSWQQIEVLVKNGITAGCNATNFCPNDTVTRDTMAVFLVRAKHGPSFVPPAATGVFADVAASYWAAPYIEQLAADGITGGCSATPKNYCPTAPVTRDQMSVFLLRATHGSSYVAPSAAGIFTDVATSYWSANWIEQLFHEGITAGCTASTYCPVSNVTRDQMAVFLVRAFGLK